MLRTVVSSTSFRSLGYDAERRVLEVEFLNGHIYQYLEVPHELYDALRVSPSKGRCFYDRIRDHFEAVQVR